jgi:phosphoglycolate phosphatase
MGTEQKRARLACLDMAGTVVSDGGVVMQAFRSALAGAGVSGEALENAMEYAGKTMGQAKSDVFSHLLGDTGEVGRAMEAFDASVGEAIDAGLVRGLPGAGEALAQLRSLGVTICLTTGFSAALQEKLVENLCWSKLVDFWLAPGVGLRGRPFPDMVLAAALRARVDDVREVAVAGDTASDLWSGWRAGAGVVAGVLTGNHGRAELEAAPHTHIIASIAELPALVGDGRAPAG